MTFLERLKAAVAGFHGYADLGRDRASGFGFMALILLLVMTVSCIGSTYQFSTSLGTAVEDMKQVPDFRIVNGEIEYEGPMPVIVEDENSVFILDTSGQTGPEAIEGRPNGMLVTRDKVYQSRGGRVEQIDLPSNLPITLSKSDVMGMMEKLWIVVPIAYVFMFLFQLGFKALDACVLGLAALIWGSATNRKVDFGLGYKLGLYAMTIPMALQWLVPGYTTLPFGGLQASMGFVLWWVLALVYLIFGLQAYYRTQDPNDQGYYGPTP
ncbi:MAG: hypothetical protein K0R39_370 [Symbiobacteriaceae bacterium]|nr:hypothetical protein [Symbiobacteriaceae bacterium]